MTIWQRPDFVELCMNAEIGAYQEDDRDEREAPSFLRREAPRVARDGDALPGLASDHVA